MGSIDAQQRYEGMYRRAYPAVLAYCRRRLPADAARDAAADVFLVAWRRFAEVPDPALSWLIRTASLTVRSDSRGALRRSRLAARLASIDPPSPVLDPADDIVQTHRVRLALDLLSEADRDVLLLTVWDDLDAASVARVLGCSRAAVRVRLHRARRRLAAHLGGAPPCSPQSTGVTAFREPA